MRNTKNPIFETLIEIKRVEVGQEMKKAYDEARVRLGSDFESVMLNLNKHIEMFRKDANLQSFLEAGLVMSNDAIDDSIEQREANKVVRASVWYYLVKTERTHLFE